VVGVVVAVVNAVVDTVVDVLVAVGGGATHLPDSHLDPMGQHVVPQHIPLDVGLVNWK
jgi:hypothetical protein